MSATIAIEHNHVQIHGSERYCLIGGVFEREGEGPGAILTIDFDIGCQLIVEVPLVVGI
ncbi:MAG: hypothetical protein Q3986_09485 [Akkermansia sp.]|nr:hypothetical protein [Akkermansia sp.]